MKVLITGFRSEENKSNASDILVTSMINEVPKGMGELACEVILRVVGDDSHTLKSELTDLLIQYEPKYCLFTGQAPSRNKITFECIATNYRHLGLPPAIGEPAEGGEIEEHGPDAYNSTLPIVPEIIKELKSSIIPASLSRWGGNSLCNQILYHGLHHSKTTGKDIRCGFIHIPALPEQVISQWPDVPFMPLGMVRQAMSITVSSLVRYHNENRT